MIFCRVGGLSSVDHKNKKNKYNIHFPPPVRKGIYAFIWPYIDLFLVVWSEKNKRELEISGFRKFKYDGPIWCHYKSDKTTISKRDWHLTDTYTLKEILKENIRKCRNFLMESGFTFVRDPYKRGSCSGFTTSREYLEVYIEKNI